MFLDRSWNGRPQVAIRANLLIFFFFSSFTSLNAMNNYVAVVACSSSAAQIQRPRNDTPLLPNSPCILLLSCTAPESYQSSLLYRCPIVSWEFLYLLLIVGLYSSSSDVLRCYLQVKNFLTALILNLTLTHI